MRTTDQERTEDYAEGIAETLRHVDALAGVDCSDPVDLVELDTATLDTLAELIDASPPPRRAGRANVEGSGLDTLAEEYQMHLDDQGTDAAGAWLEQALDIIERGRRSVGGSWNVDEVAVLVTAGGPHAEVIETGDDTLRVVVFWGSSEARRVVHAPNLAARIAAYVEELV